MPKEKGGAHYYVGARSDSFSYNFKLIIVELRKTAI